MQLNYASYAGGNWMAKLPNATTLSQISMPGSHDTMTLGGAEWGPILLTQTMTLIEQLYSGIRMVDMRLVHIGNAFVLNHGSFYLHANFDDVLSTVAAFVRSNPGEVRHTLLAYFRALIISCPDRVNPLQHSATPCSSQILKIENLYL